ncbi:hypothetical protein PIB30_093551 [Stylosanthes scabra]|uniref:Putative plant transposon protein domain-containing protein n=1 Tax=Stylosanthes scabra TaxID=79078 RepID=A0ABU6YUP4_9FABA|nr:hypothetical protein [Stylosanthes scabra]
MPTLCIFHTTPTPTFQQLTLTNLTSHPRLITLHTQIPIPSQQTILFLFSNTKLSFLILQQHSSHPLLSLVLEDKHRFKFGVRDSVNLNQAFIMASSSSVSVFDNHRFKTAFNEELYNTIVKNKKVIAECCIDLDEDEYPEVKEQISLRGWRRLLAPKQEINIDLIHEFYANAVVTEEEMEEAGGYTFRSFVRGVPVDFSPGNIQTVIRFRTQVQGAATDFETRKEHDQQLDRVLADLCMPGATWKLSTGQLRVPNQLRRQELNPVARGWHEFSIHSLILSSNRSEIQVIRAILIHCIMRGEDVRAEDIIADKIVRMAQGIKEKGKLGFPSTIYKLCKEAGVPLREFRRSRKIQAEKPITARKMESTRLPSPVQQRQQEDEEEDHPMPQAGEGNEEENVEQQGDDHDYDA